MRNLVLFIFFRKTEIRPENLTVNAGLAHEFGHHGAHICLEGFRDPSPKPQIA